jgi:hypothetical protein
MARPPNLRYLLSERDYKRAMKIIERTIRAYNTAAMRRGMSTHARIGLFLGDVEAVFLAARPPILWNLAIRAAVRRIGGEELMKPIMDAERKEEEERQKKSRDNVKNWVDARRNEIDARVDKLLNDARKGGLDKEEAKKDVIEKIYFEIIRDPSMPPSLRTKAGQSSLLNMVKSEVDKVLRERKEKWEEKKGEVLKDRSAQDIKASRKRELRIVEQKFKNKEISEDEYNQRKKELGEFFDNVYKKREDEFEELKKKYKKKGDVINWELKKLKAREPATLAEIARLKAKTYRGPGAKAAKEADQKRIEVLEKEGKKIKDIEREKRIVVEMEPSAEVSASKAKRDQVVDRLKERMEQEMARATDPEDKKMIKRKYKNLIRDAKRKYGPETKKRFPVRAGHTIEKKVGKMVMKGFILACLVGIGVVVSAITGQILFMFGFMSWGFFYLMPDPSDFKIPDEIKQISEDNPLKWGNVFSMNPDKNPYFRNPNTGWGLMRTFFKIGAFICFTLGISNVGWIGNIPLIIVAFMGYYSFKISYDVEKPHELIESIIRFGFFGFYFIPWFIMYGIFDSMLLAFIAMAFFAIPPIPKERKNSELFVMYDFYDKIIFGIIMIGVLIGFLSGWEVSSTLSATFIYFWFVTGISGFFSPAEARPAMGFIMLGGATVIYGIGPGTQEVMSALFGPWWPTIQNTFQDITEPIGDAFGGFAGTLRSGWLMLTDPVGYATQLMNGTHAENPIGSTGALGLEIKDVSISPIFPGQPYVITAQVSNDGAFNAKNVRVHLSTSYEGSESPREWHGVKVDERLLGVIPIKFRKDALKFGEMFGMSENDLYQCYGDDYTISAGSVKYCDKTLSRQDVWQPVFTSDVGVDCDIIEKYKLREKHIPIRIAITYDYWSNSTVDVEFISKNEWARLATSNQLNQKLRIILSKYSTAPVEFPIGTPGLKNPILSDQSFHIGMTIQPSNNKGGIDAVKEIVLEYPSDLVLDTDKHCTPKESEAPISFANGTMKRVIWRNLEGGTTVIYCPFKPLGDDKMTGSINTYVVKANAVYTFTGWKDRSTKIEFGGKCCNKKDCLDKQDCVNDMCVPEGSAVPKNCSYVPDLPTTVFKPIPNYATEIENAVISSNLYSGTVSESAAMALVAAIIQKESSWNPSARGPMKEFGLMQLRFGTAKDLGFPFKTGENEDNYNCDPNKAGNLCHPTTNIYYGTKYLKEKLDGSGGSIICAMANYNAGSGCKVKNDNICSYTKLASQYYYEYYYYLDYCGEMERLGINSCKLSNSVGAGGCVSDSQCDQKKLYGKPGSLDSLMCRSDTGPRVCCMRDTTTFDANYCITQHTAWKTT